MKCLFADTPKISWLIRRRLKPHCCWALLYCSCMRTWGREDVGLGSPGSIELIKMWKWNSTALKPLQNSNRAIMGQLFQICESVHFFSVLKQSNHSFQLCWFFMNALSKQSLVFTISALIKTAFFGSFLFHVLSCFIMSGLDRHMTTMVCTGYHGLYLLLDIYWYEYIILILIYDKY